MPILIEKQYVMSVTWSQKWITKLKNMLTQYMGKKQNSTKLTPPAISADITTNNNQAGWLKPKQQCGKKRPVTEAKNWKNQNIYDCLNKNPKKSFVQKITGYFNGTREDACREASNKSRDLPRKLKISNRSKKKYKKMKEKV